MKLSRPVRIRCERCRSVLATVTEAPEGWGGALRVPRCDRCFLYRGDFLGRAPAVLASGEEVGASVRVPLLYEVPWEELRRRLASTRPSDAPLTLTVNDTGGIR